jgi:hypothetical protein
LLTAHDVEAGIRERQRGRVSFTPHDRSPFRSRRRTRDREHPYIEIEPGYLARRADKRRNISGDRPSATSNVEHAVAILRGCQLDERLRPGISECRHDVAFVRLCNSFTGKLPG